MLIVSFLYFFLIGFYLLLSLVCSLSLLLDLVDLCVGFACYGVLRIGFLWV